MRTGQKRQRTETDIRKSKPMALKLDTLLQLLVKESDAQKTVKNYRSTMRILGRLWYRKRKGLPLRDSQDKTRAVNPDEGQLAGVDYGEIFASGARNIAALFNEAYPDSPSTAANHMGFVQRAIKTPMVREIIGWSDEDVARFVTLHVAAKDGVETTRKQNVAPKSLEGVDGDFVNLIELEKEFRSGPESGTHDHALLAMMTMLPPRRDVEYNAFRWAEANAELKPEYNWIVISDPVRIVIQRSKTQKYAQPIEIVLDTSSEYAGVLPNILELASVLKAYRKKSKGDRVFRDVGRAERRITQQAFGRPLGNNPIRRLYSDWMFQQGYTTFQLEQLSQLTGHNLSQSLNYLTKPIGAPKTSPSTQRTYVEDPPMQETSRVYRTALETQLITVLRGIADLLEQRDPKAALEILRSTLNDIGE